MIATVNLNFAVDISPVFHVVPKGYDLSGSTAVFELRDKSGAELYAESSDGITVETITLTAPLKYADGTEIAAGTEVAALRVAPDLSSLSLGDPAHVDPMQYRYKLRVDAAWKLQGWLTVWPDTGPAGCMGFPVAVCCGPTQLAVNVCGVINNDYPAIPDFVFGEIHTHDNIATQVIQAGDNYTRCGLFTNNGGAENCTPDFENGRILLSKTGWYQVTTSISFSCDTNNVVFKAALFLDDVEQDNCHAERKIGTGADIGNMGLAGLFFVPSVGQAVDLRFAHDATGDVVINVKYCTLVVERKGFLL